MKRKLSKLFSNMCCSRCKSDFSEDSFEITREEDSMLVFKAHCPNCGKSFGVAFLGISDVEIKDRDDSDFVLQVQQDPKPIDVDEVLDAHKYIKEFDSNWQNFMSNMKADKK